MTVRPLRLMLGVTVCAVFISACAANQSTLRGRQAAAMRPSTDVVTRIDQSGLHAVIDGKEIHVPYFNNKCFVDPDGSKIDRALTDMGRRLYTGFADVIQISFDCQYLMSLRNGKPHETPQHWGVVGLLYTGKPLKRTSYLKVTRQTFLDVVAAKVVPGISQTTRENAKTIEERLTKVLGKEVSQGEEYILGVLENDGNAIYVGYLGSKKVNGDERRTMYVIGYTLIHGWPIALSEYSVFEANMDKLQQLLSRVKDHMSLVVEANSFGI